MGVKTSKAGTRKVSHYLASSADDAEQTSRYLAQVLTDALCALKRLQVQGALDAYPEWRREGSIIVQLGIPEGADAAYLKKHPFVPAGSPLMVITGPEALTELMVGFARSVSTRWRMKIVTGKAKGPARLEPVMMVAGADVVISEGSLFTEHRRAFEEAGWTVRELRNLAGN